MQPPLRVEGHEPHHLADVDYGGTRAPASRQERGPRAARRGDEALLAPDGVPSSWPVTIPIMIAWHEDAARTGRAEHAELRAEAPLGLGSVGGARVRHAAGVDVVAQKGDDRVWRDGKRRSQRPEDGLGIGGRRWGAGVPDQEQRDVDFSPPSGRDGRGAGARQSPGAAAVQPDAERRQEREPPPRGVPHSSLPGLRPRSERNSAATMSGAPCALRSSTRAAATASSLTRIRYSRVDVPRSEGTISASFQRFAWSSSRASATRCAGSRRAAWITKAPLKRFFFLSSAAAARWGSSRTARSAPSRSA